jgi:hypothetical protein
MFFIASSALACALALQGCGSSPALVEHSQSASSNSPSAAGPADPGAAPQATRDDQDDDQEQPKIQIRTLSNRADLVSGGDAWSRSRFQSRRTRTRSACN